MNKTLEHNLVKPSAGLSSLPGHTLVVMRGRDGGMQHYSTVDPGDVFRTRSFLDSKKDLVGYYVTRGERLRHSFSGRWSHDDGVHMFSLDFTILFRVVSAEVVVGLLKSDPLNSIESESRRVLSTSVSRCPWTELLNLPDFERYVLALKTKDDDGEYIGNLERLQRHASTVGIELRQVEVKLQLSDEDVELAREHARIERLKGKTSLSLMEMEDQQRLRSREKDLQFDLREQDAMRSVRLKAFDALGTHLKGIEEALGRVPESAKSMRDIQVMMSQAQDTFAQLGGLVPRLGSERTTGQSDLSALPLSEAPKTLPKPVVALSSELAREVQELSELTASLPLTAVEKAALLSAALHLIAESEHAGSERDLAAFQKRFDAEFRKHAQTLDEQPVAALRSFKDRHAR